MQGHSIGALSKRTGVNVTTIRYYEGRGLLPDPGRTGGGSAATAMPSWTGCPLSPMPGSLDLTLTPLPN